MILLLFMALTANANPADYNTAQQKVLQVFYKQSGAEDYVTTVIKDLDTKYLPKAVHDNGVMAVLLLQLSLRHQVGWKWSF